MKFKALISILLITILGFSFPIFAQESQDDKELPRPVEKIGDFTISTLEILAIDFAGGFVNNLSVNNPKAMNFERIKDSFTRPWKFDNSDFERNQFIHPFAGALYYTAARANTLNFYESAFLTGMGSYLFENLYTYGNTSINDLITTSVAGTIYGEMLHRISLTLYNVHPVLGWIVSPLDCINMYARKNRPTENIGSIYYADGFLGASYLYNMKKNNNGFNLTGGSLIIYENPFGRKSHEPFDNFSIDINFSTNFSKYLVSVDADGTLYSWQILHDSNTLSSIGLMLNYRVIDSDDYKNSDNSVGLFMRQQIPFSEEDASYYFAWDLQLNFVFLETNRIKNQNNYGIGLEAATSLMLETKRIAFRLNPIFDYELQRNILHLRSKLSIDFKFTPYFCLGISDYLMLTNKDYLRNYAGLYIKIRYH